ncbi:hypothetical protein HOA55_00040 [archaeon]|jgi:hypothetical protein|nr:hypothetical protein [archaeon]MBT3577906.1 hypothetical protein [archaeon]MBT6819730.1 hypothetical protein [archaeon]MBT6956014.1 hypothetical protein [archaeon]MBT7025513.1 hypothetical protein [archaeon]
MKKGVGALCVVALLVFSLGIVSAGGGVRDIIKSGSYGNVRYVDNDTCKVDLFFSVCTWGDIRLTTKTLDGNDPDFISKSYDCNSGIRGYPGTGRKYYAKSVSVPRGVAKEHIFYVKGPCSGDDACWETEKKSMKVNCAPPTCVKKKEICGDNRDNDCDGVVDNGCPTIPATPATDSCTDSDGGENYFEKGTLERDDVTKTDYCWNDNSSIEEEYFNVSREYSCDLNRDPLNPNIIGIGGDTDTGYYEINYDCPNGCSDGACIDGDEPEVCTDSDGGTDYFVKGTTGTSRDYKIDNCNGDRLEEFICTGDSSGTSVDYECPNGCSEGACISDEQTCTSDSECVSEDEVYCSDRNTKCTNSVRMGCVPSLGVCMPLLGSEGLSCEPCPNGCSDGACVSEEGYMIYGDSFGNRGPNLVEVGGKFSIHRSIQVPENQLDNVPMELEFVIGTPEGDITINLSRNYNYTRKDGKVEPILDDKFCYYEEAYGLRVCSLNFWGEVVGESVGDYSFVSANGGRFELGMVVPRGYLSKNLVLTSKYNPGVPWGEFRSLHGGGVRLTVEYGGASLVDEEYAGATVDLLSTETGAENQMDEIFEEIVDETGFNLNTVNVGRQWVYMIRAREQGKGIVGAFWRSGNNTVMVFSLGASGVDISSEDVLKALGGKHVTFEGNVAFSDWPTMSGRLLKDYLVKYPSSLEDEELSCVSDWVCDISPVVCPAHGKQKNKCRDLNGCQTRTEYETSCSPGICSGCFNNNECIPYGFRLAIRQTFEDKFGLSSYCDIDGKIKPQREDWTACQNSYECESNLCSGGECTGINQMIQSVTGFKSIGVKLLCRFAGIFAIEDYEQCIYNYLGEGFDAVEFKVGDANHDGDVDEVDYAIWAKEYKSGKGLSADFSGNGKVDIGDYTLWAANYDGDVNDVVPSEAIGDIEGLGEL